MATDHQSDTLEGQNLALRHAMQALLRTLTREQKGAFDRELQRFHRPGRGDAYYATVAEMHRSLR